MENFINKVVSKTDNLRESHQKYDFTWIIFYFLIGDYIIINKLSIFIIIIFFITYKFPILIRIFFGNKRLKKIWEKIW